MSCRFLFVAVGSIMLSLLIGCGGGGSTVEPPNPPDNVTLMSVSPNKDTQKSMGTWTLTVPAGTVARNGTVRIEENIPPASIRSDFSPVNQKPYVSIIMDQTPKGPIEIDINNPKTRISYDTVCFLLGWVGDQWNPIAQSQRNITKIVINQAAFTSNRILGLIGSVLIPPISSQSKMVVLAGSQGTEQYPLTIAIIPGLNAKVDDFVPLAQALVTKGRYRVVFGFDYDYRQDIVVSAKNLYDQLNALQPQWRYTDILGHSAGGIVASYMIQKVGRPLGLNDFYGVNTPNNGSIWANIGELVGYLQNQWFNSDNTGIGIALADAPVLKELTFHSAFLENLNSYYPAERTQVDFCFVGGREDPVVDFGSSLGSNVDFSRKTGGRVRQFLITGNHSSLVKSSSGIASLLNTAMVEKPIPMLGMRLDTGYTDVYNDSEETWDYSLVIHNWNSDYSATLNDLSMEEYDYAGNWIYPTKWYNPFSGQFDNNYHKWNYQLGAGQIVKIRRIINVDMTLPKENRPCSKLYLLRCVQAGVPWIQRPEVPHNYNGIFPADAHVRSR